MFQPNITDKELIQFLINQHSKNYTKPSITPSFEAALRAYTIKLYIELTKSETVPSAFSSINLEELSRYAYHLVIFRAALGDVSKSQILYDSNYQAFLSNADSHYVKGLINGNPLLIRAHIVKLDNLANTTNVNDYTQLLAQIEKAKDYINHLNPNIYGGFKALMDGYLKFTLAQVMEKIAPSDQQNTDKFKVIYDEALRSFKMASSSDDNSCNLYANTSIHPKLPFDSINEGIEFLSKKRDNLSLRN